MCSNSICSSTRHARKLPTRQLRPLVRANRLWCLVPLYFRGPIPAYKHPPRSALGSVWFAVVRATSGFSHRHVVPPFLPPSSPTSRQTRCTLLRFTGLRLSPLSLHTFHGAVPETPTNCSDARIHDASPMAYKNPSCRSAINWPTAARRCGGRLKRSHSRTVLENRWLRKRKRPALATVCVWAYPRIQHLPAGAHL